MRLLLYIFCMLFTVLQASATSLSGFLSNKSFIDPSCIAPQFGYSSNNPCNNSSGANAVQGSLLLYGMAAGGALGGGAGAGVGLAGASVSAVAYNCGGDVSQTGSNTNNNSLINNRIAVPNFLELKTEIYGNILKFINQNVVAMKNGQVCSTPLQTDGCTIVQYQMPNGAAVTVDNFYDYVVYSLMYQYFTRYLLETNGKLDELRNQIGQTYSTDAIQPFATVAKNVINQTTFVNGILNTDTSSLRAVIDEGSTKIALALSKDVAFQQKMSYSSLARFPITARLVECLDGTFANLFYRDLTNVPFTPYKIVQIYFQPIVIIMIVLYIISKGYHIMMAHGIKDRNEIIMFFIQIAMVSYFAIGDAWRDFFFAFMKSFGSTIGGIVLDSLPSSADGCNLYKSSMYPHGKGNIALFDAIDCKLVNYLGLPQNEFLPGVFWIIVIPMVLPVPFIGWFVSFLGILYTTSIAYTVLIGIQMYILSIVSMSLLVFLTPLVAPLALFEFTKDIYSKWLTKIIGVIIQQAMSIVIIVITFAIMDTVMYGSNPETKLFEQNTNQNQAVPQPNFVRDDCYGSNWLTNVFTLGGGSSSGAFLGAVPPVCVLHKYTKETVRWIGIPIPGFLWFFSLPLNIRIDLILSFIIPAIATLISMFIITQLIQPLQSLADQISGASSSDVFGTGGKGVGSVAMKKAGAKYKEFQDAQKKAKG